MIDAAAARHWCEELALHVPSEAIPRDGRPYLVRYFLAGWSPVTKVRGPAIFLHHFVASDDAHRMHSHPWALSVSLILVGGYREERCNADGHREARVFQPGDVNVIAATDIHRIDLLAKDCWTLFLAGDYQQAWRFVPPCDY